MGDDFLIISTLRSDIELARNKQNDTFSPNSPRPCQFYMLSFHLDRMLAAARAFGWTKAILKLTLPSALQDLEHDMKAHLQTENAPSELEGALRVQQVRQSLYRFYIDGHRSVFSCPAKAISLLSPLTP